jgi:hypothetical protein
MSLREKPKTHKCLNHEFSINLLNLKKKDISIQLVRIGDALCKDCFEETVKIVERNFQPNVDLNSKII